ncbi:MFS general substrate transporter [Cryphonectria parasitica EP155]|uniref:Lysosomal dipeptide transporter MFSD1 n=1 Tax=Cryphonectria parasitica (strain ATCC 38755 / EP155) TaxID=660469 RepID=A0A9P5CL27_CRYP1|nr:MFS general substrate transporter [Cryphonectria parasitica EP155]KAF3762889.1 MFS general substrate transporter [Cryphonectria parasitica EP155]
MVEESKAAQEAVKAVDSEQDDTLDQDVTQVDSRSSKVPLSMKIIAVALVSAIGFGSHWSSGVTGAMKSTLKKELNINNTQYAVLEASEDFMVTALILVSGLVTDRIGGAGAMLYGNAIFSVGAILIAAATQVRNYKFMIFGTIVQALGDIATQVAQYKIFSSWFAPSNGFASTLGFELGIGKIGSFVGQATANIIATNLGDFAWVYWMAVFMNLFTNVATLVFYFFNKWSEKRYGNLRDPATGEKLTEKSEKWDFRKMLELPWPFWLVIMFSLFQTSAAIIFSQNATELAEQRFNVSAVTAGWYSSLSQYMGFFFVPLVGIFIDILGNRLSVMMVCGCGMLVAMCLAAWGPTVSGTAASFGVYAVALTLGPTVIVDSIRTSMWYHEVFGSAYAVKIAVNNSMNIIVRVITGVIQDADDNSYDRVVIVYVFLTAASVLVALVSLSLGFIKPDIGRLQWTRKKRILNGHIIVELKDEFEKGQRGRRNKLFSKSCFIALLIFILGSWAAYFWGVATGNND